MSLRRQLGNSLVSIFWPQDHIWVSRLWTVPSEFVPIVSCLIASSLSIIINFFCGPYRGMLFFYSSCLLYSGSSAFSKTGLNILKFTIHVLLKPGLENFAHYFTSVWDECNCVVVWSFLALPFFGIEMKTDLFQSCGHCWVFQICWHIECSTFKAPSFRIWNSSPGISSPPAWGLLNKAAINI